MAKRKSINGSRARHENPIPNASRVGNVVMSSVIGGTKTGTRELPAALEEQVAKVTVISTISSDSPMIASELRTLISTLREGRDWSI